MAKKRRYWFCTIYDCSILWDTCEQSIDYFVKGKPNCLVCEIRRLAPKDIDIIIKKSIEET